MFNNGPINLINRSGRNETAAPARLKFNPRPVKLPLASERAQLSTS